MVINRTDLWLKAPINNMVKHKINEHGVSYGLTEAGYDIRLKQEVSFVLPAMRPMQRFQLASAMEEFHMPEDLVGVVHDKSTWARRGLSVFNTVIEPGWKGFLTLELVYHGSEELVIPAGAGIAQVLFHKTSCKAAYSGKYQNQEDEPVPARSS